jgi:hemerythrin
MKPMLRIIKWNKDYAVGIEAMDVQHREFISVVNELVMRCTKDDKGDRTFFLKTIHVISSFAKSHFSMEERLMQEIAYPCLEEHQKQHAGFIQTILNLVRDFEEDKPNVARDLACFLVAWVMSHLPGPDRKYADYMRAKNITCPV